MIDAWIAASCDGVNGWLPAVETKLPWSRRFPRL